MFKDFLSDLLNDSMGLEVMVESEMVSKRLKSMVLDHRSVVSERDISTIDYNLSRLAVQNEGLSVVDDFFYPYLMSNHYDQAMIEKALGLVRTFYDMYCDSEVLQAVTDYLETDKEFSGAKELFTLASELIIDSGEKKRIPRSFSKLLLKDMNLKQSHAFLEDDLEFMPLFFKQKVVDAQSKVYEASALRWSSELDLYEHSWSKSLQFENFSDPVAEVRWVLSRLKDDPGINIFYPPNCGYESIFLVYQKEFFEEQVVFSESNNLNEIKQILDHSTSYRKKIQSTYDSKKKTNFISLNSLDSKAIDLKNFIENYIKLNSVNNQTLNFFSDIVTNLDEDFTLSPDDWFKLIEKKFLKERFGKENLITKYGFYKYGEPPKDSEKKTIVLGWGSELFKRQGQNWISPQLAYKLENDLGLESKSLFKTQAHDLLRFLPKNSEDIILSYPKITLKGESRHQGLLKTLKDKSSGYTSIKDRQYNLIKNSPVINPVLKNDEVKLSVSSLNRYYTCPYKYYLEKNVGLVKEDIPDYSMSPKDEGSLMHQVMEELENQKTLDLDEEKFSKIVHSKLTKDEEFGNWRESQARMISKKLWPFFYSEINFLKKNNIRPKFLERNFQFYLNLNDKSLSLEPSDNKITIRGAIDRVDEDSEGNIILYDYKRSGTGSYAVANYTESSPLNPQAFIYYLAADLGCLGKLNSIAGFQFINLTTGKREKGFLFKDLVKDNPLIQEKGRPIERAKFEEKLKLFKERLFKNVRGIVEARFEANPIKESECDKCDWRGVCKKTLTFT